jgi:hypothetical protein
LDCYILAGISCFFIALVAKGFTDKIGNYDSPYFLFFLIFPVMAIVSIIVKRSELRYSEIETGKPLADNYKAVKETLKVLGWQLSLDKRRFLEAFTNNFGFWTSTDQMITIIISDNKILYNSIGNVDTYATQLISWGQHSRNRSQFKETLGLILSRQHS